MYCRPTVFPRIFLFYFCNRGFILMMSATKKIWKSLGLKPSLIKKDWLGLSSVAKPKKTASCMVQL